jgi:hypothetical protein
MKKILLLITLTTGYLYGASYLPYSKIYGAPRLRYAPPPGYTFDFDHEGQQTLPQMIAQDANIALFGTDEEKERLKFKVMRADVKYENYTVDYHEILSHAKYLLKRFAIPQPSIITPTETWLDVLISHANQTSGYPYATSDSEALISRIYSDELNTTEIPYGAETRSFYKGSFDRIKNSIVEDPEYLDILQNARLIMDELNIPKEN